MYGNNNDDWSFLIPLAALLVIGVAAGILICEFL